ncbi:MAG: SCP2 sterol-binding domain-containing protein [Lachnospiraceae bacterium]|nr:SCP2 sterol-binding domain-containing protein [Lachnospiraceae bacterium]
MKVNIYYGGRGLIEDPTISVINRMADVLRDLRVEVKKYNLYEDKNGITALSKTLKEADGVVLATTVEWMGIGGLMHSFLDACWLYCDKERIKEQYMIPVVMASTYGEREGMLTLNNAWEILGGITCDGICAYVKDHILFETNPDYNKIIEKKTEIFYRSISQKMKKLPSSNQAVTHNISYTQSLNLTPKESEQLSVYASDETFVKKQKEDIKELTDIFKELLNTSDSKDNEFIDEVKKAFVPVKGFNGTYALKFKDKGNTLFLEVNNDKLHCNYVDCDDADVFVTTSRKSFEQIVKGNNSFEKAFMTGEIVAKGDFNILRQFDKVFKFK